VYGAEALARAEQTAPDVVLMYLRMPGMDGIEAITALTAGHAHTRVLVLTTYDTDNDILRAIEAGAAGYLLKDVPSADLARAVRAVARGDSVLAPVAVSRLARQVRAPASDLPTARELDVLRLVADGASNREAATALHISEATVKSHLLHLFAKLGVEDRTAAVTTALRRGLLRLHQTPPQQPDKPPSTPILTGRDRAYPDGAEHAPASARASRRRTRRPSSRPPIRDPLMISGPSCQASPAVPEPLQ
jgi:DNA-binding NarL/FixJ family response regulator